MNNSDNDLEILEEFTYSRPKKFRTRYISTSRWIFLAFSSIELKKNK